MQFDASRVPVVQLDPSQDFLTVFVVLGPGHASKVRGHSNTPGRIKAVKFSRNTDSPMLVIQWKIKGGRRVGIDSIHLSGAEEKNGSRFLRDLYKEDGRIDLYDAYVVREKAATMGRKVADIRDAYLPKQVLAWRASEAAGEDVFDLPLLDEEEDAALDEATRPALEPVKPQRRRASAKSEPEAQPEADAGV